MEFVFREFARELSIVSPEFHGEIIRNSLSGLEVYASVLI